MKKHSKNNYSLLIFKKKLFFLFIDEEITLKSKSHFQFIQFYYYKYYFNSFFNLKTF